MISRGIQDAYELSPVQAGMLFHAQLNPGTGVYVVQLWTRLSGELDEAAFREAWAWAAARHPALRTAFVYESISKPLQVVHREVQVPLQALDWTGADEDEVQRRMDALLREDRARGFVLSTPPLLRLALVRLADDEHTLVLSLHHLVLDGWSYTTLFREVLSKYAAILRGAEFDPPAPRPYKDFIGWIKGRDRAAAEAFWRAALAGVSEPTPLGIDGAARGGEGYGDHNRHLSAERTAALHEAARARRVTLATLVEGAWALVLSRYAGADDVVFGWTGSGRPESLPGAERMCGLFVDTLPARVPVRGGAALGPWLRELQEAQLAAREHEHVPLVEVQGWTEVARGRPLFESILAFENFPRIGGAGDGTGGLAVGGMRGASSTGYPLTLIVHPGERMHLRAYQDRARIDDRAAERLLGHFATALHAIGSAPVDALLGELEILPAEERALVLGAWAAPRREYPEQPMHRLFAEHAVRTPEKIAVTAADGSLTYGELEARANRLSHHLIGVGVRPGQIVAMGLDRGTQRIVALLAIVKAGAAYLPLDPAYPADRLAFLMDDAGATVIVTDHTHAPALPLEGRTTVFVDTHAAEIASNPSEMPRVAVDVDDPLYVVYTSGSTGVPKGVLLSHRALARLVRAVDYADFGAEQVWMHFVALTFDTSAMEIWGALANGGRLAVFPPHPPTLDELGAFWREQGVTTVWLTAGLFHQLIDARLDDFGVLRQVMAGGDILSVPHCRRLMQAHPRLRLINGYGPSENGTYTSAHVIRPSDLERTSIPIGRPVPCTTCYVLDGRMQPAPIGVWGELLTGGDGVAIGYLDRPEMTAERFITLTLDGTTDRVYRTGDRVRWMEDGVMEFLGRTDFQVKIRGFRVEPGEVEQALQAHPAVRDAVVVARADAHGEKRLVGYFVGEVGAEEMREHLRGRLPEHMVPSAFVRMDGLPLNRHGKVDRGALPDAADRAENAADYVAPRTETEKLLAALWAEVLGVERVGVTESFFGAGGHSLQAMQLVTRVREALRVDVPLRTLFDAPSVAELVAKLAEDPVEAERIERTACLSRVVRRMPDAEVRALLESTGGEVRARTEAVRRQALLSVLLRAGGVEVEAPTGAAPARQVDAARQGGEARGRPPLRPAERGSEAALSFAQQRLWFVDQMGGAGAAYHVPSAVRLRGRPDARALRGALEEVVRRHEALRTVFRLREREPVQVILPPSGVPLPLHDLSGLPAPEREDALQERVCEEARRPFDLAAGPLFRAVLVRLGAEDHALLMTMHHIVSDGWSLGVLHHELEVLYGAFSRGEPSPLEELPVQYADYALWQRADMRGEVLDRQLAWWKAQLSGAPALLELPTDRPRPAVQTYRGAWQPFHLSDARRRRLEAVARGEGATLFMVLLAAWQVLLGKCTGAEDVVVGSPIAGRTRSETEALIGFFVNTLGLRADLRGNPEFRELVGQVRERTLGAYEHQDLPFERLVEELAIERSLSHTPLVQVTFALRTGPAEGLRLAGLETQALAVELETAKFDLTLSLEAGEAGLEGRIAYSTELFEAASVARLGEHYRTLLETVADHPGRRLSELSLLSGAERRQVLVDWNAAAAPLPGDRCVHELFREQAERTPEAVAVHCGGLRVSYAELSARAERTASLLRGLGVGAEQRVAIFMERGVELVASLLGVLRAGGCYVPVDPAYPSERVAYLLRDSGAAVVLTQADLRARLPAGEALVLEVDRPREVPDEGGEWDAARGGVEVDPAQLAYVIYTSGSTGTPKGVQVSHRNLARSTAARFARYPEPVRGFLLLSSVSFDSSVAGIFWTLCAGGTLHLPEGDAWRDPALLAATAAREGVSHLLCVPSLYAALLDEAERLPGWAPAAVIVAGEECPRELVRRHFRRFPGAALYNEYGPTEGTVWCTVHACREDGAPRPVPIGRPVPGARLYVLDPTGAPVPVGVPGEAHVGGGGVARGYLGRRSQTAERFVPDPFSPEPGARMYRTGDRVRWLPGGEMEFLGRIDQQVKIRGFRIEPGEVEAALRQHPDVRDCAVLVREDAPGEKRIVAYVVGDADAETLRAHLRQRLPDYMVPGAFAALDALPLTPNGKLDRSALPAPASAPRGDAFVAPRTQTERVVAQVFATVLGIENVGAADDFFSVGGHSLLATRVVSRVGDLVGVELPLRALFEHSTVQALAAAVDAAPRGQPAEAEAPITARRRTVHAIRIAAVDDAAPAGAGEGA